MGLKPRMDELLELRHQAHAMGLASNHLVSSALTGLYASVFRGQGLDFEEVRDYREGDDIRNIEWKVTARTGQAHVKLFREERERTVIVSVDQGPHMSFGTRGTYKSVQAARAAALLGWAASSHHDRVGGVTYGTSGDGVRHFQPTRDRRGLWRLLRALSEPEEAGEPEPQALLKALERMARGVPRGALIFMLGRFDQADTEGLRRGLALLSQRHDVVMLPVDDPADWHIPAMGRVAFAAPDGSLVEVDTDDEGARARYRQRWEERRQTLQGVAHGAGAWLLPLRTDEDVHLGLKRGLRQRARARQHR